MLTAPKRLRRLNSKFITANTPQPFNGFTFYLFFWTSIVTFFLFQVIDAKNGTNYGEAVLPVSYLFNQQVIVSYMILVASPLQNCSVHS